MNLAIVQMTCYSVSLQVGRMLLCMHRHLDWPHPSTQSMTQISSASEYWVLILFAVLLWCPMLAIMFLLSLTTHYWCRLRCSAISTFVHRRNLMKCLIHCNRAWTFICQGTPARIFGLQFLSLSLSLCPCHCGYHDIKQVSHSSQFVLCPSTRQVYLSSVWKK